MMNQKGFTLIEVLVAMVVGSLVMTAALLSLHQIVWGSARTNDQVVALTDVNYAALRIKKDFQMARYTNLPEGIPQDSAALSWDDATGWVSENETAHHSSRYDLFGTDLRRTYDGEVSTVGRHITSIEFTRNGRVITCVISATGPWGIRQGATLELIFRTRMRPEEL